MGRSEHTFSENDLHCTPPAVFEPILEALRIDRFGLDPFGNPGSIVPAAHVIMLPEHWPAAWCVDGAPCATFSTQSTRYHSGDAYNFDWSGMGVVFCNGPTSACSEWAEKMHGEEGGDENVSLWPVRTGANWWQDWVTPSDVVLFYRGRVTFQGAKWQAPWHNCLSYVGPRGDLFVEGMKQYGWVVRNRRDWG